MDVSGAEGAVVLPVQRYKACCGRLVDTSINNHPTIQVILLWQTAD